MNECRLFRNKSSVGRGVTSKRHHAEDATIPEWEETHTEQTVDEAEAQEKRESR